MHLSLRSPRSSGGATFATNLARVEASRLRQSPRWTVGGRMARSTLARLVAKVAVGASFRGPSYQCIVTISGPYVNSRKSGLWARPLTP